MLFDSIADKIAARLSDPIALVYRGCWEDKVVPLDQLRQDSREYFAVLESSADEAEFLDLGTAEKCLEGCEALIDWASKGADEQAHHAIQAAVRYYILEDDAEGDDSIVGFDDDLQVVQATARVLGVELGS